jgi:sugar phosphate isomerase/epimerase
LKKARELNFDTIDFNIASAWHNKELEDSFYGRLEEGMAEVLKVGIPVNGIHISFGTRWDVSDLDEKKRYEAVKKISDIFERTSILNPYCYIIHPSFEPIADDERYEKIESLKRSIRTLSEKTDRIIALETIPRTCLMNTSREAIDIIDDLDLPNVKICIDVNHFLYERSEDAAKALGTRIATTHISDHDYVDERHWIPKRGKIDWMRLISTFESVGYTGVFNYEVKASFEDIKKNYEELFEEYNSNR